jgi:hypothetical protein
MAHSPSSTPYSIRMLWAELLVLPVLERLDSGCGEKTAWRAALDSIDLVTPRGDKTVPGRYPGPLSLPSDLRTLCFTAPIAPIRAPGSCSWIMRSVRLVLVPLGHPENVLALHYQVLLINRS